MGKTLIRAVMFSYKMASGQTALSKQLKNSESKFSLEHRKTFGADFIQVSRDNEVLQLWETASDPRYFNDDFDYLFYHDASIVLYCIDLSRPLDQAEIIADIEQYQQKYETFINLVGTKSDIARPKSLELFIELSYKLNIKPNITSAKDKIGVSELLDSLFNPAPQIQNPPIPAIRDQLLNELDEQLKILKEIRSEVMVNFSQVELDKLQQKFVDWKLNQTREKEQGSASDNSNRNAFFSLDKGQPSVSEEKKLEQALI
ncbi:MAG: hypothetical protein Q8M03_06390 [Legionella sp.]|nr:hypothetical protein [Legionella sp.]